MTTLEKADVWHSDRYVLCSWAEKKNTQIYF